MVIIYIIYNIVINFLASNGVVKKAFYFVDELI